jgi:hypothetical protein
MICPQPLLSFSLVGEDGFASERSSLKGKFSHYHALTSRYFHILHFRHKKTVKDTAE